MIFISWQFPAFFRVGLLNKNGNKQQADCRFARISTFAPTLAQNLIWPTLSGLAVFRRFLPFDS
ncbi:MAG: hypothetical protein DU429_00550 [Candidatus Tokpelaia sp.]|nr:MAG: hypothetical protein DU430_06840 [Candidatus Tokpelaia sp.]KAA6207590.1 MAG: hypothetical protein DU429_00550 [Candidatus Tokpelaia sp.]KAA6404761.1 hypothetical protein DPQ22_07480 [Candidatus Tokpelaia sp.]